MKAAVWVQLSGRDGDQRNAVAGKARTLASRGGVNVGVCEGESADGTIDHLP